MSNYITKDELAKIAISKNLIKEYKSSNSERTVYLNDGTEFQIYLKNPYQTHLGVKIYVNNQVIGSNMLVLRPGQSFWLDRFLNDNKKFLFSTYDVENTAEMKYATNNNGKVKIEFYHEKEETPYFNGMLTTTPLKTNFDWTNYNVTCRLDNPINTCCYSTVNIENSANAATNSRLRSMSYNTSASTTKIDDSYLDDSYLDDSYLETGRVEKGGVSRQEFECCDINFDYYAFKTENILILPTSRKQIRAEETRRRYCSQCGKKVHPKDKFCSNCGAKLT